ncbi:PTS sugar transporter subunit IIA [bacterium]|nr:PTS sugar transporter subunit IIA [bacterium]
MNTFNVKSLARYLGRDARDIEKLASQGRIPGQRINGDWRFHSAEVHHWLEREIPLYSDSQLGHFERTLKESVDHSAEDSIVSQILQLNTIAIPLEGRTLPSVLRSLVELANANWQVFDPSRVFDAVRERESLHSTALAGGVALPHPGSRLTSDLGESILAFGRTNTGIPFANGQMVDLFFLILARDQRTHIQTLARLSRMIQREDFLPTLRQVVDATEALEFIQQVESDVIEQDAKSKTASS